MKYTSSIVSSSIGNILEWYDFGLFALFSTLFSELFFPSNDPQIALITTVSIFAVGFLCRPIGALIFGYMGDTKGRAKTLRLSILMIALPTLLIGLLPSYERIGILAPILLTLTRIWQGLSIGGEYSGNIIYLAETAPRNYRATFTSLASTGANMGILLASLVGLLTAKFFTQDQLISWGWRLPYLASGLLCIFIYFFRLRIHETEVFEYLKDKNKLAKNPIITACFKDGRYILMTLGLVCMGTTFYYFCFIYLPIFLSQRFNYDVLAISTLMTYLMAAMIILVPLAGFICDTVGRRKMFLLTATIITLCTIPGFYFLQTANPYLMIGILILFTLASSLEQGVTSITVVENFPADARYTGVSLGYNLGNGFLGGTVPMVCGWLAATAFPLAPAFYITICTLITGFTVYFFISDTRNKNLS